MDKKRVLLIVSGSVAAYKSADIVRRCREKNIDIFCILTSGGAKFTTALTLQSVSGNPVYQDLFSLTDENEMGHIRLAQEVDAILVAPASANMIACMANGLAHNLASATLLASNKPVLIAPSMNTRMWEHPATKRNLEILESRAIKILGPEDGEMACGEIGIGRMLEPTEIVKSIDLHFKSSSSLAGLSALVTSGPTFEPIDVVRFIGNRSSGKQGHAIAAALTELGAKTKLVTGPTNEPPPQGVHTMQVGTAEEMLAACTGSLPVDIIVCAAAVSDWRAKTKHLGKIKKNSKNRLSQIELVENPDILANLTKRKETTKTFVIGFAAESDDLIKNAQAKLVTKGCNWIIANGSKNIGGEKNQVHLITEDSVDRWPLMTKKEVATRLAFLIAKHFGHHP